MAKASFADLPVELLYQIFDHLDGKFLFHSIRCLSKRFYAVLSTYDRYQLNSSPIPLTNRWKTFIHIPPRNIVSLSVRNAIDTLWKRSFRASDIIGQCPRLHSLSLEGFDYTDCVDILRKCIGFPLVSLSIHTNTSKSDEILKHLFSTIVQFNIRVLTINTCTVTQYRDILHRLPHLRSLTIQKLSTYGYAPNTTAG